MSVGIDTRRVAVVTGGSGVLGRACVKALIGDGLAVAIIDRRVPSDLDGIEDAAVFVEADVTAPADVDRARREIEQSVGPVGVVVNVAGIARPTRFDDIALEEWRAVLDASITGTFLVSRAFVPGMREAGWGRVINFSSTAGKNVSTLAGAHYTTAKAGILGMSRALAKELGPAGITVNSVCPGIFETHMARSLAGEFDLDDYVRGLPVPRIGDPSEVGALVRFLASDEAGYITGASIDINGGELMV